MDDSVKPREPGQLDTGTLDMLHEWLLLESAVYRYACEHKLAALIARWQAIYLDEFYRTNFFAGGREATSERSEP